jgi:hypothetical protein
MSRWCGSTRPVRLHGRGSEPLFGAADAAKKKGDGSLLCRAPEGPFRQKTPVPFLAFAPVTEALPRACPRAAWNKNAEVVHQRPPPCRRLPQTGEKTGRRRLAGASGPCAGMGRPPYRQPSAEDLQKIFNSPDEGTPQKSGNVQGCHRLLVNRWGWYAAHGLTSKPWHPPTEEVPLFCGAPPTTSSSAAAGPGPRRWPPCGG